MSTPIDIVIMAAGKGTRMKSATPKVLQKLAHQGLVQHVLDTAAQLQARQVVVITGHEAEQVEAALAQAPQQAPAQAQQPRRQFVRQMPQLGTGHAVQQAAPVLADDGIVVVLSGDVPLTQAATVQELVRQCAGTQLALLTLAMPNPFGYGRVMRNAQGHITRIVEQKDGTPEELAVNEIYSGILAAPARLLKNWLARLDNNNAQQEFYLTDIVKHAVSDGVTVVAHTIDDAVQVAGVNSPQQLAALEREYQRRQADSLMAQGVRLRDPARLLKNWLARLDNNNAQHEFYLTDIVKHAVLDGVAVVAHTIDDAVQVAGVNSPQQLAALEREYQRRQADSLMAQGVRLRDPARLDVRGSLQCGQDVEIDVNCVFEGKVTLGNRVRIAANCVLANCQIGDDAVIHPFTHIDGEKTGASVGAGSLIGPFARLRPGAQLAQDVHIGNFVEVKNSTLAAGAKANHLAYLGDADVGERVNYGAGSITANYDGANKHRTVIEADVHIGSNSVLIAPVTIGAGGTVGAGSAIGRSTPAGALTVTRGEMRQKPNYRRPVKQPKQTKG